MAYQRIMRGFRSSILNWWVAIRAEARRRPAACAAVVVVGAAAAFRFIHIGYGLPHLYYWDEAMVVNAAREMLATGRWWPDSFYRYPSLLVDLQAVVSIPAYFRALESLPRFAELADVPLFHFYFPGRVVVASFGVAGVIFVYLIGSRVWGKPWWGVAAAALLAVATYHVYKSRQIHVEVPLATLTTAAVYFLFKFRLSGKRSHFLWSAALLGAAVGTKYNAGYYVPAVALALAMWRRPARDFVLFGLIAAGVFIVSTPGVLFRLNNVVSSIGADYYHYKVEGHGTFTTGRPLLEAGRFLVKEQVTPVAAAFVIAGVVVVAARYRRDGLALLAFPVLYEIAVSRMAIWTPEIVLDVLPWVALSYGAGLGTVAERLAKAIPGRGGRWAVVSVAAAAFCGPGYLLIRNLSDSGQEDPRTSALTWAEGRVPWPAYVVKEVSNLAPLNEGGETDGVPLDENKYIIRKVDFITRTAPAAWARAGAVYYFCHREPSAYPFWTRGVPGALDALNADPDGYWRNFDLVTTYRSKKYNPGGVPISIYRLRDETLVAAHPYRRVVPAKEWTAVNESPPHVPMKRGQGWVLMYTDGRVGCYFTAPAGARYRLGFRLRADVANGIPPRARVYVDGRAVADFGVVRRAVYWTAPLNVGGRRYKHLIIKYYNDTVTSKGGDRNLYIGGVYVDPV